MSPIAVGGVPEHFNLPWHLALASGEFDDAGVEVEWKVQTSGTGQMMANLADGELDVAIALTDGAIAAIARGNPSRIVHLYVTTPLLWGVHTQAGSDIKKLSDIGAHHRFAISRFGSGSHLMAHVLGHEQGLEFFEESFEVVGDLDGGVRALTEGRADLFLWDSFMTTPHVASGDLERAGIQPTPWPAFVVVATERALADRRQQVESMLRVIARWEKRFSDIPQEFAAAMVTREFGLTPEVARRWRAETEWNAGSPFEASQIEQAQAVLHSTGVVADELPLTRLVEPLA